MGDAVARKRQRLSPSPIPNPAAASASADLCSNAVLLASSLRSSDPCTVASALNGLLRVTSDDRANYALGVGGDAVVDGLVAVFDWAIGWEGGEESPPGGSAGDDEDDVDLEPSERTWEDGYDSDGDDDPVLDRKASCWTSFCRRRLAPPTRSYEHPSTFVPDANVKTLDAVVVIVRNLSYVAANLRFLAHSPGMLRVLRGCLYYRAFARGGGAGGGAGDDDEGARTVRGGAAATPSGSNVCVHALHALLNLAPLLDATGRRYFADRVLLDPSRDGSDASAVVPRDGSYGRAASLGFGGMLIAKRFEVRDESLSKVPDDVVRGLAAGHVRSILALFPALLYALRCEASRPVAVAALEVLTALVDNPDSRDVFLCTPDALLARLVDLLYVPRLGPDGLEYVDPVSNVVSRVSTLKLLMGYDASVDSELRDRSAELLVKLTGLGPDLRRRLGRRPPPTRSRSSSNHNHVPSAASVPGRRRPRQRQHAPNARLYDALAAMLTTGAGRSDAPQLAAKLLANLAAAPENRAGVLYVESRAVSASSRNPHVANVICNGIFSQAV